MVYAGTIWSAEFLSKQNQSNWIWCECECVCVCLYHVRITNEQEYLYGNILNEISFIRRD